MAIDVQRFLEDLKVNSQSISAIEFKPGASYLIVGNDRLVSGQVKEQLVEGLYKAFGVKVAVMWVFGEPDNVISAFRIKETP